MADSAKKVCFVVGPIGEADSEIRIHADWFLEEIVEPVIRELDNFEVVRADKIAEPGMIDAQVIGHLLESEIVVADLSGLNPNAFYEIGLRHMIQKPIIHMQLSDDKIPFDVSLYRAIKFSRVKPADIRRARDDLRIAVKSVLSDGYKVDNPVTRARGQISLELQASPREKVLGDQMKALQQRMRDLEKKAVTADADAGRRFIEEGLNIGHEKLASAVIAHFHEYLYELLGDRVRRIRTTGTNTTADFDLARTTDDDLKEFEKKVQRYPGVSYASIIPF